MLGLSGQSAFEVQGIHWCFRPARFSKGFLKQEVAMKLCGLSIALLFGLLCTTAQAQQPYYAVTHAASLCIDPPDLAVVARSEHDKGRYPKCTKWSPFHGAAEVFAYNEFLKADSKLPAVNRFAQAIMQSWFNPDYPRAPNSRELYDSPKRFGLIEVPPSSKELHDRMLIVWRGGDGMIAYVVEQDVKKGASSLERYQVLYPSKERAGELRTTRADWLAASLPKGVIKEPKFLRPDRMPIYWNQWIEDADGKQLLKQDAHEKQKPEQILAGRRYTYHIDFSALDFSKMDRKIFKKGVEDLIPKWDRLRVTLFLDGDFHEKDDPTSMNQTVKATVDGERLLKTLKGKGEKLKKKDSFRTRSLNHGTLMAVKDNVESSEPGLVFSFTPKQAPTSQCANLVVVVWSEEKGEVLASWVHPTNVLPPTGGAAAALGCGKAPPVAQPFDIAAIPRFDPGSDPGRDLKARITFLDFTVLSMGFFEDLRPQKGPLQWILTSRRGLRQDLVYVKQEVDAHINDESFDPKDVAAMLQQMLFRCKDQPDEGCPGQDALRALLAIAAEAKPKDTTKGTARVQATFRDMSGSVYYLPLHLLRDEQESPLGDAVLIDQSLALPSPKGQQKGCVKNWNAGFILELGTPDAQSHALKATEWISNLSNKTKYTGNPYDTVERHDTSEGLRDYFDPKPQPAGPEGLVLLAHHGEGIIADRDDKWGKKITPENIRRVFAPGSFAVLAACSVGRMSEKQQDNSLLLDTLNKNHIQAAIVSPFEVPHSVAIRFLTALGETLENCCAADTGLYDLFNQAKKKFKEKYGENNPDLPRLEILMLVGDGDTKVCGNQ